MNAPHNLVPLRVPELGPSIGQVVTGTGRVLDGFPLEAERLQLATKVIEMAGEARRLAASDERSAALATLGREAWLVIWDETVSAVAVRLLQHLSTNLMAEAVAVRMPQSRRRQMMIDETERQAIAARLGTAGAGLIPVIDTIDHHSTALVNATASDRGALAQWQESQTMAGRRLEASWIALESAVGAELVAWHAVGDEIGRWRKPLWPVVVTGTIGAVVALWLGLILGGFVDSPAWMTPLLERLP